MKKCVIYVKSKTEPPPPNQPVCECILLYFYVCGYAYSCSSYLSYNDAVRTDVEISSIDTGPSNLAQAEHAPLFDRELGDTSEQS